MADQFDFTVKTNPMQGISLADLVAARTPALTTALQGTNPILQALQARKQNAQRNALIQQAAQGNPVTAALLGLGIVPPQFRQPTPQYAEDIARAKAMGTIEGGGGKKSAGVERGSPEWNAIRDAIINKTATLDDAFRGFNQAQRQYMIADIKAVQPKFSFPQAKGETGAVTKTLEAPASPGIYKSIQLAKSLVPQIDLAAQAAQAVSSGNIQSINRLKSAIGIEFGSTDWSALQDYANGIADEFQAQIGQGSDAKLNLAQRMISTAKSPTQLLTGLRIIQNISKSRAQALSGQTPTVESIVGPQQGRNSNSNDALLDKYGTP